MSARCNFGFTLVEVMVALAIVAIALMAGTKARNALTDETVHMEQNFLGNLCAQNALNDAAMGNNLPPEGENTQTCTEAGQNFTVKLTSYKSPHDQLRIVKAQVMQNGWPIVTLATIIRLS